MISKEEVQHIADLARLGLTSEEIEKLQRDLSSVLDYIDKLKKVDISRVDPVKQMFFLDNEIIKQEECEKGSDSAKKIIDQAPSTKNGYIKVKSIF